MIKPLLTAGKEHPQQECRLSATINDCAMYIFAYLRCVGDGRNLKANLECSTDPQDRDHLKEPPILYLQS